MEDRKPRVQLSETRKAQLLGKLSAKAQQNVASMDRDEMEEYLMKIHAQEHNSVEPSDCMEPKQASNRDSESPPNRQKTASEDANRRNSTGCQSRQPHRLQNANRRNSTGGQPWPPPRTNDTSRRNGSGSQPRPPAIPHVQTLAPQYFAAPRQQVGQSQIHARSQQHQLPPMATFVNGPVPPPYPGYAYAQTSVLPATYVRGPNGPVLIAPPLPAEGTAVMGMPMGASIPARRGAPIPASGQAIGAPAAGAPTPELARPVPGQIPQPYMLPANKPKKSSGSVPRKVTPDSTKESMPIVPPEVLRSLPHVVVPVAYPVLVQDQSRTYRFLMQIVS